MSDAATESQSNEIEDDPAVVLAGKVTLSVINDSSSSKYEL